jgi:hypothetical protein
VPKIGAKTSGISQITMIVASPEKAGVGGSTPSLATTFQTHAKRGFFYLNNNSVHPVLGEHPGCKTSYGS